MKNISWSGGAPTKIGTNLRVGLGWFASTPITFVTRNKLDKLWALCEV